MKTICWTSFLFFLICNSFAQDKVEFANYEHLQADSNRCTREHMQGTDAQYSACIKATRNITFRLFEEPNEKSKQMGLIKVTDELNNRPLIYKWVKPDGKEVNFKIDGILSSISDSFWENSHTYIGCHGNWYKLPRNPFPTPVWLKKDTPCIQTTGLYEGKLKWDLVATEVGTNRRVLLPKGKILRTHYENGKVVIGVPFRYKDILNDHPDISTALKERQKHGEMSQDEISDFILNKKDEILNEYRKNGVYKAKYVLEMKDFLDKDQHLPITQKDNEIDVEVKYLDEERENKDSQSKK